VDNRSGDSDRGCSCHASDRFGGLAANHVPTGCQVRDSRAGNAISAFGTPFALIGAGIVFFREENAGTQLSSREGKFGQATAS